MELSLPPQENTYKMQRVQSENLIHLQRGQGIEANFKSEKRYENGTKGEYFGFQHLETRGNRNFRENRVQSAEHINFHVNSPRVHFVNNNHIVSTPRSKNSSDFNNFNNCYSI